MPAFVNEGKNEYGPLCKLRFLEFRMDNGHEPPDMNKREIRGE